MSHSIRVRYYNPETHTDLAPLPILNEDTTDTSSFELPDNKDNAIPDPDIDPYTIEVILSQTTEKYIPYTEYPLFNIILPTPDLVTDPSLNPSLVSGNISQKDVPTRCTLARVTPKYLPGNMLWNRPTLTLNSRHRGRVEEQIRPAKVCQ